jgi:uncharacterized membrane protein YgdD (TMEM256/DUF423 family)
MRLRMRLWLVLAAIDGALAVALGAFATHALSGKLDPRLFNAFDTGARYQMYHALALGLTALAMRDGARGFFKCAAICFFAGTVLFSGSLYVYALTTLHPLVFVTPLGGGLLIAGWVLLALGAARMKP